MGEKVGTCVSNPFKSFRFFMTLECQSLTSDLKLLAVNCDVGHAKDMSKIRIGSDCSGIGTDAVAMSRLGLDFVCAFASESSQHCRDVLDCVLAIKVQCGFGFSVDCM